MKGAPPPLLPILRSRLQAELLTAVLLAPSREWSLTDLARQTGASLPTVQREIKLAEQAGLVTSRRIGNMRLVTAAKSPLTEPMTELLLRAFGPRQVLSEEMADISGVDQAFLFGSWAARYEGKRGRPPADIDVLVIGKPDRDKLDDAAQRAGKRLAQEINITIRSMDWWRHGNDGFRTEVLSRPLAPITDADDMGGDAE